MQPAWLALSEQHSAAAKWVLNSILFTVLQSRVFSWNVTEQHSWCCDITVCTLQLLNLNNFIHCKFILIENKSVTSILQRKSKTAWFTLHHLMEEVSCFSQKEGLVLSTTRSSKKKNFRKYNRKLIKRMFLFLAIPICTPWCSLCCKVLSTFWKNPSCHEVSSSRAQNCVFYFDFAVPCKECHHWQHYKEISGNS